ncbi:MAG: 2-amino-4-hydroxy-6-hydroxymethyldihydropteridine diphosphokinase [Chloroflexi bacterium]|nr:2-amino-4-hydroxy-6-hydroxymethyldihydropteridine diphosphokinase [Chloroflexota bacterium]
MPRYVVGIGSNIRPAENVAGVLRRLLDMTDSMVISRIIETTPEGFQSDNQFLNLAVCMGSPLDESTLKAEFVRLEIDMGRNRNDPQSSKKDRPADLDILFELPHIELPPEPYLRPLAIELVNDLGFATDEESDYGKFKTVTLEFEGQTIGQQTVVLKGEM